MSLRDRLDCLVNFVGMILLAVFFLVPSPNCFFQSLLPPTLCSRLEILSTANNFCNFWHSKIQQVNNYAFCSWDVIFAQKWNCCSPNNFCKCTKSPSTLSTNNSRVWNLYLSSSNHFVTSFRLEMNVGGFSKHQNKTSDTDRYKKVFFHRSYLSDHCVYYEKSF